MPGDDTVDPASSLFMGLSKMTQGNDIEIVQI